VTGLRRPTLPLAVWGGLIMLVGGLATLLTASFAGTYAAIGVLVGCCAAVVLAGTWLGWQFERVTAAAEVPGGLLELRRMDEAMRALRLRIRVADEIAERHRRDADSAGTGMFELLSGLVAAEEGTRGQLAAELHDSVAQSLGAARRLLAEPPDDELWAEIAPLVEEAEEALRATMARTRPPALRDGDLAAAVSQLRDDLELRYGLAVELEWPVIEYPLPLATAVTVYRFFQPRPADSSENLVLPDPAGQ
jgi:signal transduction histidine kinase